MSRRPPVPGTRRGDALRLVRTVEMDVMDRSAHRLMKNLAAVTHDLAGEIGRDGVPYSGQAREVLKQLTAYLCEASYMTPVMAEDLHGRAEADEPKA